MRRAAVVASLTLALLPAAAPAGAAGRVLVIGLPEAEARRLFASGAFAVGLGVNPDSRRATAFVGLISFGAPPGREGVRSPFGGGPHALRRALEQAGATVRIAIGPAAATSRAASVARAFEGPVPSTQSSDPEAALDARVGVAVVGSAEDAAILVEEAGERSIVVLGVGDRTPVLVGKRARPGLLDEGVARRPGIVTPYDVAATVLAEAGLGRPAGFIGNALRADPRAAALESLDRLAARLERDASYGFAFTAATVALALGALALGLALAGAGARAWALRFLQGASLVPAGYVAGLFVQSGRAEVRALALLAAFFAGAAIRPVRARAICAACLLAAAGGILVLTLAAAARPGGEPALSLWGDPLVSWRFFGLRNHLVAFVTGGLLVGAGLLGWRLVPWALAAVAAAVVVGAAPLAANFVGVLTLVFGAALALLWRWRDRVRAWHLPAAAAAAAAAFALALLADTGSPASHGGIAVRRVASGGIGAAFDYVRVRARLNYAEMRDFPGGFVWGAMVAAFLVGCLVWAAGRSHSDPAVRAGVAGAAAAALAALALEDSGFFTATDLGLFPAIAVAVLAVERGVRIRPRVPPPGAS